MKNKEDLEFQKKILFSGEGHVPVCFCQKCIAEKGILKNIEDVVQCIAPIFKIINNSSSPILCFRCHKHGEIELRRKADIIIKRKCDCENCDDEEFF